MAGAANLELVGKPAAALVLTGSLVAYAFTMVNRLNGLVQCMAFDASGLSVDFLWSDSATGTTNRVPAGGGIILPVYKAQTWYFQQGSSAGASLQPTCVG